MSHDQRPAKLRVVKDAASANGMRRGDSAGGAAGAAGARNSINNGVNAVDAAGRALGANAVGGRATAGAAAGKGLPMLQAGLFLVACLIGGVAFAIVRPF